MKSQLLVQAPVVSKRRGGGGRSWGSLENKKSECECRVARVNGPFLIEASQGRYNNRKGI